MWRLGVRMKQDQEEGRLGSRLCCVSGSRSLLYGCVEKRKFISDTYKPETILLLSTITGL